MNVLHGHDNLRKIHEFISKLWYAQNKNVTMMVHFWWPDKKNEIYVISSDDHNQTAAFIHDFCEKRHPSAIVMVTEGWAYAPRKGHTVDWDRAIRDPEYYAQEKIKMECRELLMCTVETKYGFHDTVWEIISANGVRTLSEPTFKEFAGEKQGRLAMFLPKIPLPPEAA